MYINPFVAGVLTTILFESVGLIIYAVCTFNNKKWVIVFNDDGGEKKWSLNQELTLSGRLWNSQ